MHPDSTVLLPDARPPFVLHEGISLVAGAGVTLAIFAAMAHFESAPTRLPPTFDSPEARMTTLLFEPPPPKPVEYTEPVEAVSFPLAGIEAAASDSPVKIAVVPADIAALFPAPTIPPSAEVRFGAIPTAMKPQADYEIDLQRVYQRSEVDRPPTVLSRGLPEVPKYVRDGADLLRVTLLILVGTKGEVGSVRLLKSSGNPDFDRIIIESVKDTWVFNPAVKRGKNVRCLAQQIINVKWSGGSPFEM